MNCWFDAAGLSWILVVEEEKEERCEILALFCNICCGRVTNIHVINRSKIDIVRLLGSGAGLTSLMA